MANKSLAAYRRVVTVEWPKHQEREAKAHLLRTARAGHAKIMSDARMQGGVAPDFDAYANAPGNTDLASVKLPGPIVFRYRYVREVIIEAMRLLKEASPVGPSGQYAQSHRLFLNGAPITLEALFGMRLKEGDQIMIANAVPYARRVELGKTKSGRDFLVQLPNRIYQRTARKLKAKYGKLARISDTFINLPSAYRLKNDQAVRRFTSGTMRVSSATRDRRAGTVITYPAIVIQW